MLTCLQEPACMTKPAQIVLLPKPTAWPTDLAPPSSPAAIQARTRLNLPIDRPIIASGHQPILFHPGIVAKLIALDHHAKKTNAHPVWIVPDQDIVDPALVRFPVIDNDTDSNTLTTRDIRIGGEPNQLTPSTLAAPISINADLPDELESIAQWLMGYEHESTLAHQLASATLGMLCDQLGLEEPILIYASELLALDASSKLLDAMLADPKAAIEPYNASVTRFSDAGVRPLSITDTHIELPLWRLEGTTRQPVFIERGQSELDRTNLIPRGLLMTAIMRSFICDLFIHGTGGFQYDQITEAWLGDWQGITLAPIAAATATMTLDFDLSTPQDPDHTVWLAHHAKHNPALLGDQAAADQKSELVAAIAVSNSKSTKAQFFAQLHQLLGDSRSKHSKAIAQLDHASVIAQQSRQMLEIANDRTWAFPLYTDQQLQSLKAEIVRAFDESD